MSEPRIRVAALIRRGDDLLLIKHAKLGRTYWLLPGGGVEEGESMHEALLRELDEECSLRSVRLEGPIAIAESIAPANQRPRKHVVHLIFAGDRCRRPVLRASPPRMRRFAATSWCRSRTWPRSTCARRSTAFWSAGRRATRSCIWASCGRAERRGVDPALSGLTGHRSSAYPNVH